MSFFYHLCLLFSGWCRNGPAKNFWLDYYPSKIENNQTLVVYKRNLILNYTRCQTNGPSPTSRSEFGCRPECTDSITRVWAREGTNQSPSRSPAVGTAIRRCVCVVFWEIHPTTCSLFGRFRFLSLRNRFRLFPVRQSVECKIDRSLKKWNFQLGFAQPELCGWHIFLGANTAMMMDCKS